MTITGGKWTTVRKMAEDCVDRVVAISNADAMTCTTEGLAIHGACKAKDAQGHRSFYGSDLEQIEKLERDEPELAELVHPNLALTKSEVVWAATMEMARTVEDVLARRSRCLFFSARDSLEAAPVVAGILAQQLGHDDSWCEDQLKAFSSVASHYLPK